MSTVTPPERGRPAWTPRRIWNMVKTPLTLLLLAAFVYFGFKWGVDAFTEPLPTTPPPPCVTKAMPELSTSQVAVSVWNGSTERGRATGVGNNLKALGFDVREVGNTDERITKTIIRGATADDPNVQLVARFFVEPTIEADGRATGTVDVLVGPRPAGQGDNEWAGMVREAPPTLPLPNGTACVAAPKPTPSATATPTAQPS